MNHHKLGDFSIVILLCCCVSVCTNRPIDKVPSNYATIRHKPDRVDSLLITIEKVSIQNNTLAKKVDSVVFFVKHRKPKPAPFIPETIRVHPLGGGDYR